MPRFSSGKTANPGGNSPDVILKKRGTDDKHIEESHREPGAVFAPLASTHLTHASQVS